MLVQDRPPHLARLPELEIISSGRDNYKYHLGHSGGGGAATARCVHPATHYPIRPGLWAGVVEGEAPPDKAWMVEGGKVLPDEAWVVEGGALPHEAWVIEGEALPDEAWVEGEEALPDEAWIVEGGDALPDEAWVEGEEALLD